MKVLEVYMRKLRYKRYAERTIEVYTHYLQEFFKNENIKDPHQVSQKQIEDYLENRNYKSTSQQNQIIGSLKLFAKYILGKSQVHLDKIERPRKVTHKQPVIPRNHILQVLPRIANLKHRSIIALGYGCGLRVSEVISLKWKDIDRDQGVILVRDGKGAKDRYTPISEGIIDMLIAYFREYKTKQYVFTGQDWRQQYSPSSCTAIVKKYIGKKYRFHSLRKSFATHLYDAGNDLAKIQDALGHKNEKTTRIYVETSIDSARNLTSLIN
jgi:integrase/recombinase XerD